MTTDEIDKLREGWDFEAKLAAGRDGRGAVPDSVWETYSAMANTSGGLILLGAKERRDGSLDLRGVVDPERVESELWNLIQNPQKVSANILRRHDVERLQIGDASLLLIRVPKAEREDRPVFVNGSWERGTYLRRAGVEGELDGPLLLLATELGSYITGQTIVVDGGWTSR